MPKKFQCMECHKINPELINCNPTEEDEYYSDDYCVFRINDECYDDEDYEDIL